MSELIKPPQNEPKRSGGRPPELRTARFWLLVAPLATGSVVVAGFIPNLQPLLLQGGLPVEQATIVTGMFLLFIAIGGIAAGVLVDRVWPFLVPAILFSGTAVASLVLAAASEGTPIALVVGAAALIGVSLGSTGDFPAYFVLRAFGRESFSELFGAAMMLISLLASIGPFAFGLLRDLTGSYRITCVVAGILIAAACGSVLVGMAERTTSDRHSTPGA